MQKKIGKIIENFAPRIKTARMIAWGNKYLTVTCKITWYTTKSGSAGKGMGQDYGKCKAASVAKNVQHWICITSFILLGATNWISVQAYNQRTSMWAYSHIK